MLRGAILIVVLFFSFLSMAAEKDSSYLTIDYRTATLHELKPHRRSIPLKGVREGVNQIHLTLKVSPTGDVVGAEADSGSGALKYWPQVQEEGLSLEVHTI